MDEEKSKVKPVEQRSLGDIDYGSIGCSNGFHYYVGKPWNKRCKYCKRSKREVKRYEQRRFRTQS